MFPSITKDKIEDLVRNSIFNIVKEKTKIKSPIYIHKLEYAIIFKKEKGIVRISSIFIKNKISESFNKISSLEIKFSGATNNEFVEYLETKGANRIEDSKLILETI